MDYAERLRRLSINDPGATEGEIGDVGHDHDHDHGELDPRTRALVQLAALIAVKGEVPSFGAHTDAAIETGATISEIVDVLVAIVPIVGLPCVVAAAPRLAMALGYDTEEVE